MIEIIVDDEYIENGYYGFAINKAVGECKQLRIRGDDITTYQLTPVMPHTDFKVDLRGKDQMVVLEPVPSINGQLVAVLIMGHQAYLSRKHRQGDTD